MIFVNSHIIKSLEDAGIKTRPKASTGLWVAFLLPVAVLLPAFKNPETLSYVYKLQTIIATGLILANVIIIINCIRRNDFKIRVFHYGSIILMSFLFHFYFKTGAGFSIFSGFFSTYLYYKVFQLLLKTLPLSFTFGEAALVSQSIVFFCYATCVHAFSSLSQVPTQNMQISTLILQIGVTGIGVIAFLAYRITFFRKIIPFYCLTLCIVLLWIIIPLHVLLDQSPVLWILLMLSAKIRTFAVILFWTVCSVLAIIVVNKQIQMGRKANTVVRKAFHILAVIVYLVGFLDQCNLLYLASGIIFAIFIALEMLRILNLPPLGPSLQNGFTVFADEKDAGAVAFTPLYLLAGCSMPMWIHPDSCDVTDSAGFNLLPLISGLLSIGIGDTFASAVGTWTGRLKWPGSVKTIEGTLACICAQFVVVYVLIHSGYIINNSANVSKTIIGILMVSLVEAKTDQVDNLILPLIMYLILL